MERISASTETTNGDLKARIDPAEIEPLEIQYQPLDASADSIRLLILKPSSSFNNVCCELIHVNFPERPKYEALSYAWGSPEPNKIIFINGTPVKETSGLDGLYLHTGILRSDLAWLAEPKRLKHNLAYALGFDPYLYAYDDDDYEYREWILKNDYWKRLWIVQEVGLARSLKVCVGSEHMEWNEFVYALSQLGNWSSEFALVENLDKKRKDRHGSSNRLEILLEDFKYAKCQEPRDKVYGFLGLAHDCEDGGIEVDYSKSLFDLYADVMRFFCRNRLLPGAGPNGYDRAIRAVKFSQLVQNLLGSPRASIITTARTIQTVHKVAAVGGTILQLGPTYDELYSSTAAYKQWKGYFEKHFPLPADIKKLREANEAYDSLLVNEWTAIEKRVRYINPWHFHSAGSLREELWERDETRWPVGELPVASTFLVPKFGNLSYSPTAVHDSSSSSKPRMFLGSSLLLGLAPPEAMERDLICQFWKTDVVALLRKHLENDIYSVVGRADLSTGRLEGARPVYNSWVTPTPGAKTMVIQMDISTLSMLTCEV